MTRGAVVVLGPVGRNFGAGMSGGVAFVLDDLGEKLNDEMVSVTPLSEADIAWLAVALKRHHAATRSEHAARLIAEWPETLRRFRRVTPRGLAPQPLPEWEYPAVEPAFVTRETDTDLEPPGETELV